MGLVLHEGAALEDREAVHRHRPDDPAGRLGIPVEEALRDGPHVAHPLHDPVDGDAERPGQLEEVAVEDLVVALTARDVHVLVRQVQVRGLPDELQGVLVVGRGAVRALPLVAHDGLRVASQRLARGARPERADPAPEAAQALAVSGGVGEDISEVDRLVNLQALQPPLGPGPLDAAALLEVCDVRVRLGLPHPLAHQLIPLEVHGGSAGVCERHLADAILEDHVHVDGLVVLDDADAVHQVIAPVLDLLGVDRPVRPDPRLPGAASVPRAFVKLARVGAPPLLVGGKGKVLHTSALGPIIMPRASVHGQLQRVRIAGIFLLVRLAVLDGLHEVLVLLGVVEHDAVPLAVALPVQSPVVEGAGGLPGLDEAAPRRLDGRVQDVRLPDAVHDQDLVPLLLLPSEHGDVSQEALARGCGLLARAAATGVGPRLLVSEQVNLALALSGVVDEGSFVEEAAVDAEDHAPLAVAHVVHPLSLVGRVAVGFRQVGREDLLALPVLHVGRPLADVAEPVRRLVLALAATLSADVLARELGELPGVRPVILQLHALQVVALAMGPPVLELPHVLGAVGVPRQALLEVLRVVVALPVEVYGQVGQRLPGPLHLLRVDLEVLLELRVVLLLVRLLELVQPEMLLAVAGLVDLLLLVGQLVGLVLVGLVAAPDPSVGLLPVRLEGALEGEERGGVGPADRDEAGPGLPLLLHGGLGLAHEEAPLPVEEVVQPLPVVDLVDAHRSAGLLLDLALLVQLVLDRVLIPLEHAVAVAMALLPLADVARDVVQLEVLHRGEHGAVAVVEVVHPVAAVDAAISPPLDSLSVAHVGA
mmetsp:Transcript_3674/g.9905  ORF Transcript_3674/g.9905 Transcript_3674/m.9905 type:complete len:819 (+) Transcript_3674:1036-3492(+)